MPIKPENKKRYPTNWLSEIRPMILARAANRCEFCDLPNGVVICRIASRKVVKIVLTIAHLDHTPENCAPENLRALCQKCHLAYDAKHHVKSRYETRLKKPGQIFLKLEVSHNGNNP